MHAGVKQAGSKEVDQVAATEQAAEPQVRRLSHGWKRLQGNQARKDQQRFKPSTFKPAQLPAAFESSLSIRNTRLQHAIGLPESMTFAQVKLCTNRRIEYGPAGSMVEDSGSVQEYSSSGLV